MADLRVGILGAAWIADRALIPAMIAARNVVPVAIASRDLERAQRMADRHGVATAHAGYTALLEDPAVDAVYIALVNSAHREWTVRALEAGKHVLCEKPLGMNAADARGMADAAQRAGRTLMEAFMYRFHPRMRALREKAVEVRGLHAAFSFPLRPGDDYRWSASLGGGALLDVGCYTLDVARWFLGEPDAVSAVMSGDNVDVSVATALTFAGGAQATTWASFVAPEHQVLELICDGGEQRVPQPFTSWRDPDDPYQIMVEEFASAILERRPPPRSLDDSIATAELIDRVRAAATPVSADAARRASR